jgi:arylsulfatase A-like enzyme
MRTTLLPGLAVLVLAAPGCAKRPEGPNILIVTLDTTRRDHLGAYGYRSATSPNIDRLAKDSRVFTRAYAVSSWTMPTHASMFTGKFPTSHGANYDPKGPLNLGDGIGTEFGGYRARPIAEDETTLAAILSGQGYTTGGVVGGPWLLGRFRLDKGFEHWDDDGITALNGRPAAEVTDAAIRFVDAHADEPFFLFLNYYDPHSPWYDDPPKNEEGEFVGPPKPLQDRLVPEVLPPDFDPAVKLDYRTFATLCYDAEIRYMDREFGRLLEHLKLRGLYEPTWIFVLSDHGELLDDPILWDPSRARKRPQKPDAEGDERPPLETPPGLWGHGDSLTEPEIHIPLIVKEPGPNARKGQDASFVQQTDLLPEILTRLDLPLPPNVQGTPFGTKHPIVAELYKLPLQNQDREDKAPKDWRHLGDWRVWIEGAEKFGWSSHGKHFLIDLATDPSELVNLFEQRPARAAELQQALGGYLERLPPPGAVGVVVQPTAEEIQALEGLGYAGGDE